MAIAYIKSGVSNPNASSATASVVGVAAGSFLIMGSDWTSATETLTSITDSQGQAITTMRTDVSWAAGSAKAAYHYIPNANAGDHTITWTWSGAVLFTSNYVANYTGVDTTTPIETSIIATGNSGVINSGAMTAISANDMAWGHLSLSGQTPVVGGGYTFRTPNSGNSSRIEDNLPSSIPAAGTASVFATGNSAQWIVLAALIKPDGGAVAATPSELPLIGAG